MGTDTLSFMFNIIIPRLIDSIGNTKKSKLWFLKNMILEDRPEHVKLQFGLQKGNDFLKLLEHNNLIKYLNGEMQINHSIKLLSNFQTFKNFIVTGDISTSVFFNK